MGASSAVRSEASELGHGAYHAMVGEIVSMLLSWLSSCL